MFEVSVEDTFSAGHALRGYKGKCENVHGHNYRVRVTLQGPQLDAIGLLVDFTELKRAMREVMGRLDHQFVNDLEPFKTVNPSAENVAKYFFDEVTRQLKDLPPGARVTDVILWETDTSRRFRLLRITCIAAFPIISISLNPRYSIHFWILNLCGKTLR